MKRPVESKKRRLPFQRLAWSVRKNIVVVDFTCLLFVCSMIGFRLGQMLADGDEGDRARSVSREPQRAELTRQQIRGRNGVLTKSIDYLEVLGRDVNDDQSFQDEPHQDADELFDADALEAYNLSPFERHWPGHSHPTWMHKIETHIH